MRVDMGVKPRFLQSMWRDGDITIAMHDAATTALHDAC